MDDKKKKQDQTRKLEKIIRQQNDEIYQLKNIIENLPGDIYWKDKNGVWLGLNSTGSRNLERMGFPWQPKDVIGKTDYDLFDKKTADSFRKNDLEVLEKGVAISGEEEAVLPSGDRIIQYSTKRPLFNRDNEVIGIIGNTVDITYLKKIENDLLTAKNKAEQANKAKTDFLYNMRHDIRTPFSGILSLTQHMAEKEDDPDKKEKLNEIAKAADIFLVYLNEILDFTQMEHNNTSVILKNFNLLESIKSLIDGFKPSIKLKPIELKFNFHNTPEWVIGDQFRIQRILVNLLSNAVKFTKKGSITVEAEQIQRDEDNILIKISVTDTGIGIPKDKHEIIFEKFTKLEPDYQTNKISVGLGLQAVKSLLNDLDGEVSVQSSVNKGSTFTCLIPFKLPIGAQNKITTKTQANSYENHLSNSQTNVLLVEDNQIAHLSANSILEDAGFRVDGVKTGQHALDRYKSHLYDFILLDIGLPDMDGFTVAQKIRNYEKENKLAHVPIIIVTAHADEENYEQHKELVNGLIIKPLTIDKIKEHLLEKPK